MRLHTMAAAIGLTLAMAGCVSTGGLHPTGALTEASSLKSQRSLDGIPVSPAAWPQQDWWTALGDSQLDALINEALHDNPGLAAADARAQQAQAAAGIANAERGPTVNGGASIAGARLPGALTGNDSHFAWAKYGYASFNWGLDLWGGKRAAWEAALGDARAADIDRQAARIELSTNVARAYTQLGYAYAQQDVAKSEMDRATSARNLTRQRVNAGIDSQLQLKQSDTEMATAEVQLALANRDIDAARSALSVLLGKGPDRGMEITRPQVLTPSALAVPGNVSVDLIGHRADLVAARWRVEAASKDIKAAKTEFLPNVSIGAMAGLLGMGGGNLFSMKNRFFEAGPSLALPIFDGGRLRANLSAKDAAYDLAVAQYNQTLVAATNDVADKYNALQAVQLQIDAQERGLAAATEAWQLAEQRYKSGVGNYLEALIVRQQLLLAQQRMAGLQAQQVDISVQLIQALGGGFRPQSEPAQVAANTSSSDRSL